MKRKNERAWSLQFAILIIIACIITVSVPFTAGQCFARSPVPEKTTEFLGKLSDSLAEIAKAVKPSVVNISTTSTETRQESPFNDPFFRRFFGDQFGGNAPERQFKSSALGSGVIVTPDGYILTNNHMVENADTIKVILQDGRKFDGRVIGTDPKTDLAVVKIDASGLVAAVIGDSSILKVGDIVIAIGNPFALNETVTMGIVSAVGRSHVGIAEYEDFIQTDAAINPGNSGGALVNTKGELVGINTAIFSTSGGYMGIGFAIPSAMARSVMDSIIRHGRVIRGWLGVTVQDLTPELAKHFDLEGKKGSLVTDVVKGGPADSAGLRRGDLVTEIGGKRVEDSTELRNAVSQSAPGTSLKITVIRGNDEKTLKVKLGELPEQVSEKTKSETTNALQGIQVQDLNAAIRDQLGVPEKTEGVVVAGVDPNSPAAEIVFRGDVIAEINRKAVKNTKDFTKLVSKLGPKESVLLLVYRQGSYIFLTIKP
jgi:serine protease Do